MEPHRSLCSMGVGCKGGPANISPAGRCWWRMRGIDPTGPEIHLGDGKGWGGLCHCDLVKYCVQERRGKGNARLPWPRLQIISAGKSYINAPVMVFRPLRPLCRAAHLAKAIWGGWRVASDPFGAAARPPAVFLLGFGLQWGQVTPTLNKRAKGGALSLLGMKKGC